MTAYSLWRRAQCRALASELSDGLGAGPRRTKPPAWTPTPMLWNNGSTWASSARTFVNNAAGFRQATLRNARDKYAAAPAPHCPRRRFSSGVRDDPHPPDNRMWQTDIRRAEVTRLRLRAFRPVRRGEKRPAGACYLWAGRPATGAAASITSRLSHPVSPRLPRRAVGPRGALLLLHLLLQRPARKRPSPCRERALNCGN